MGKKKRIMKFPQKFGRKFASYSFVNAQAKLEETKREAMADGVITPQEQEKIAEVEAIVEALSEPTPEPTPEPEPAAEEAPKAEAKPKPKRRTRKTTAATKRRAPRKKIKKAE